MKPVDCGRTSFAANVVWPTLQLQLKKRRVVEISPGMLGHKPLSERQGAASIYQRGSRIPRPPNVFVFWRRYAALVASARFASKTDFCSFAVLMAAQNEASILASSA